MKHKCVCEGNWRLLVNEYRNLIGRKYKDRDGVIFTFFGLVWGDDDFYYGMYREGKTHLLSCVGDPEGFGYTLVDD